MYFVSARLARPIETVSHGIEVGREPVVCQSAGAKVQHQRKSRNFSRPPHCCAIRCNRSRRSCRWTWSGSSSSPEFRWRLGVEPRFLTMFFSDLENFSTHAEQLAPDELLDQMSTYFEEVSRAISEEHGTVDKFIGDGVMAFWGAPAPRADHVLRACAGALRAARRMETVNQTWRAEGRPSIRMRIGLHCANVLVGNVGSSERLSYTVMGDGVNVAARLEGMNKIFGTTICISDSVVEAVGSEIVARPLRRVKVKGRKHEFMIYELLGIANSADPELEIRAGTLD